MGLLKPHKPSDYPSFLLYLLDETHITVTAVTAAVILYTRDAHAVWFASGALLSSFAAKGVKKFIKSPRPPAPPPSNKVKSRVRPKKTYGMPSTHSTALSFYLFYILPLIPFLEQFPTPASKWLAGGVIGCYWMGGIWSRVELGYHTWNQCCGGIVLGWLVSKAWFKIWLANPYHLRQHLQLFIDVVWTHTFAYLAPYIRVR